MKTLNKIMNASFEIKFGWIGFTLFMVSLIVIPILITLLLTEVL